MSIRVSSGHSIYNNRDKCLLLSSWVCTTLCCYPIILFLCLLTWLCMSKVKKSSDESTKTNSRVEVGDIQKTKLVEIRTRVRGGTCTWGVGYGEWSEWGWVGRQRSTLHWENPVWRDWGRGHLWSIVKVEYVSRVVLNVLSRKSRSLNEVKRVIY